MANLLEVSDQDLIAAPGAALVADERVADWHATGFLEKLTALAPSVIYIFNQKTQSNEYANRSLGEAMGYSIEDVQSMGETLLPSIMHPADLPALGRHFQAVNRLKDGEVARFAYRVRHKDGRWIWLKSYDTVFERDDDGSVLRHLGVAVDITRQKKAEARALEEKSAAEITSRELRAFAYSISHDLKAPSNTLELLLSELTEHHADELSDGAQELLGLCQDTVGRMQTLIEEVLDYTRVIGDETTAERIDLNAEIASAAQDLRADIDASKAELTIGALPTVIGQRTQLRRLFQNLIGNALKYTKPGTPPQISIFTRPSRSERHVAIDVVDEGIGIAQENQERIFELFERLHLSDDYPGSGLGLAVCRRVARSHGGDVTVRSRPGQGATFTVTLVANG